MDETLPRRMTERQVTLVGGLMVAVGPLSITMYTPAVPQIVTELGTSETALKATISIFFAGFAMAQLVCGTLSDGLGRKAVGLAFFGLYVFGSLLALLAPSLEVLLVARLLQGIGAAAGTTISRALVRDLFVGQQSSRLLNGMAVIIAIAPAVAPVLGGLVLTVADYRGTFFLMALHGALVVTLIAFVVRETVRFDPSRIRPRAVVKAFRELARSPRFMLPTLAISGIIGASYGQATLLPFILMSRIGLSPVEFGLAMALQSTSYFLGSLAAAQWLKRVDARRLVPYGVGFIALGAALIPTFQLLGQVTVVTIVGPVIMASFGFAHAAPALMTATYADFPRIAGAAASLNGFLQMAAGLFYGIVASSFPNPVLALAIMTPAFILVAAASTFFWYRGSRA